MWQRTALMLAAAVVLGAPAHAAQQLPGPAGWAPYDSEGAGVIAAYRFPESDGTYHQLLNAVVYSNYPSLGAFIAKNEALLHKTSGIHVLDDKRIKICGGEPAWEVAYSHPGMTSAMAHMTVDTEQVVTVKGKFTYIANYVRLSTDPNRPDADKWIHAFCRRAA